MHHPIQTPILDRFGDVFGLDGLALGKGGYRARHFSIPSSTEKYVLCSYFSENPYLAKRFLLYGNKYPF